MNRKLFLTTTAIGLGSVYLSPSSVLTSNSKISLHEFGNGFSSLENLLKPVKTTSLSTCFNNVYNTFIKQIKGKNYVYNSTEVISLSETCFALPMHKKSIIGNSKVVTLFIKESANYKAYCLNERTTKAFDNLIINYMNNSNNLNLNLDVLKFIVPQKNIKQKNTLKEKQFTYKNCYGNTITMHTFLSKHSYVKIS